MMTTEPARRALRGDDYADLAAAVERGAVVGDGELPPPPRVYLIELEPWETMTARLLLRIVNGVGSIRRAAPVLGLPRSTLGARVKRAEATLDKPR